MIPPEKGPWSIICKQCSGWMITTTSGHRVLSTMDNSIMEDELPPLHLSFLHFDERQYESFFQGKVRSFLQSIASASADFAIDGERLSFFSANCDRALQAMLAEERELAIDANRVFLGPCRLIRSPTRHCRQRVRFQLRLVRETERETEREKLRYVMWEEGAASAVIEDFPIAAQVVRSLMPRVLSLLERDRSCDGALSRAVQAVHFLSSTLHDVVVTLVYSAALREDWESAATAFRDELMSLCAADASLSRPLRKLSVLGRSRGEQLMAGEPCVEEHLHLQQRESERVLRYRQVEAGFSNPNSIVNERALQWLCDAVERVISPSLTQEKPDLLEMFCGNGNHTVALSAYFRRILAVELNERLCEAARENLSLNAVQNVRVLACDSAHFAQKVLSRTHFEYRERSKESKKERQLREGARKRAERAKKREETDLTVEETAEAQHDEGEDANTTAPLSSESDSLPREFSFGTVLVDPPRAGLDDVTLRAVTLYQYVLYISCNPDKLIENLQHLCATHEIAQIAAFDHFAYTPHLEVGVLLRRRSKTDER